MKTTKDWVCFIIAVVIVLGLSYIASIVVSALVALAMSFLRSDIPKQWVYEINRNVLIIANTLLIGVSAVQYVRKRRD